MVRTAVVLHLLQTHTVHSPSPQSAANGIASKLGSMPDNQDSPAFTLQQLDPCSVPSHMEQFTWGMLQSATLLTALSIACSVC